MDIASIIFFASGATLGVWMLINLLKGHHIPKALTIIHGTLVVTGLVLLIIFNLRDPFVANWVSVILFIMAAAGGIYILTKDIKHKKVPIPVVIIHLLVAVSGFTILIIRSYRFHT